ncbi:hypothetical protein [Pseudomonas oryzihabitans]|uniref:hypothetical protein n=1 Tax=Pseudomonas oryzihabitans TaxID=47885 RepID=UPI0016438C42|nr:hypothetical protein [Pseudomonas oryzihabitans]
MSIEFERELQLIMIRSMNLDFVVSEARRDPELLRQMILRLSARMDTNPTDEDASLLRWAEAMLAMHRLKDLYPGPTDS